MKAFGSKYLLGLPEITSPAKAGSKDGRIGLRVSPSLVGLNPNWGEKGKPVWIVPIPLTCQFAIRFSHQEFPAALGLCPNGRSYVALMETPWRMSKEERP